MSETTAVRGAFVELWARMGAFWGVTPTTARVLGWLLSKDGAQSADEIMEGVGLSRGAVSMAARELREWGLVHPERSPGSRQIRYRPETDFEKAIKNIVAARKRREWEPILEHLREWIPKLERERSAEAVVFRERLRAMEALVAETDALAEALLEGGTLKSLGLKMIVRAALTRPAR